MRDSLPSFFTALLLLIGIGSVNSSYGQVPIVQDTVVQQARSNYVYEDLYDITDAAKDIGSLFKKKKEKIGPTKQRSGISYLPNINYNPSIGAQIGIKAVGGIYLGDKSTTNMSVFATALNYTTRGIFVAYIFHDIYTKNNNWNIKGSLVGAQMVGLDYGMSMGRAPADASDAELLLSNPERNRFVNSYQVYGFSERIYRNIMPGMFAGAGVFFELKRNIHTQSSQEGSPNDVYSSINDLDPRDNNNNGLMFNLQYLTRDNPNSAYKGIYTDIVLRVNQKWMGSTAEAFQLQTDFRKYWSLSTARPNHVLAFWHYGSYNLSGKLNYLDLPGTGKDPYARSGRGYTNGYFKGLSYFYSELEYRFPILRNQFLSGVVFANIQSTDNVLGTKLFQQWQPAAGGGLRILFNKMTRTNLCIDYAVGRFGQHGLFLGLNEAF